MNYGLCMPVGSIFRYNEVVVSCDIFSFDDFVNEIKSCIKYCKWKEGIYTYYEGHKKFYELNVDKTFIDEVLNG